MIPSFYHENQTSILYEIKINGKHIIRRSSNESD